MWDARAIASYDRNTLLLHRRRLNVALSRAEVGTRCACLRQAASGSPRTRADGGSQLRPRHPQALLVIVGSWSTLCKAVEEAALDDSDDGRKLVG